MKRYLVSFASLGLLIATLITMGLLRTGSAKAASLACSWTAIPGAKGNSQVLLNADAAISLNNVWAVGYAGLGEYPEGTIEQWTGKNWHIVSNPNPGGTGGYYAFTGIAATSATDIWAAGYTSNYTSQTVIEHWDGMSWSIVSSPNPSTSAQLYAVSADSSTDAWAAGNYYDSNSGIEQTLIEHWNGTAWSVVSSSGPGTYDNTLSGIDALSANNVWAVGYYQNTSGPQETLIEHWDGTTWSVVPSSNPSTAGNVLSGIAATHGKAIWAVGYTGSQTLIERWNGSNWSVASSPNASTNDYLQSVTVNLHNDVWAVGTNGSVVPGKPSQTLIEHWNGTQWNIVASPDPGLTNELLGVAGISGTRRVWTVGASILINGNFSTLTEFHC